MPRLLPHLLKPEIGWCKVVDVVGDKTTVYVAPWAKKYITEGGILLEGNSSRCNTSMNTDTMKLNRDYFVDQYKVVNYLRKHGFAQVENVSPSTVERGRKRQPPQNTMVPAAAAAAAVHVSTKATTTTKGMEELPKATKQNSKSSSSSSSSSTNAVSSAIPETHQKILTLLGSLTYANPPGTHIDDDFRPDYLALRQAALPPNYPPVNLGEAGKVWNILSANNDEWHWFHETGPLGGVIRCRTQEIIGPKTKLSTFRENIDYFRSETDFLEFVEGQFLAHGDNYDKFIELSEAVYSTKKRAYVISKEEYLELTGTQVSTPPIKTRDALSIHH